MHYVKGFEIDWKKIKIYLNATDDQDRRIDSIINQVMESVDRDEHWLVGAYPLEGPREAINVISLGEDAFGDDAEELARRELPIPKYLQTPRMQLVLSGPRVFIFQDW